MDKIVGRIEREAGYFFNRSGGRILVDDVASGNYAGQQALLRFGFEHDPSAEDVFKLRMTRERYNHLHGPPEKADLA